ncbi:MAG: Smr/MutS family protein [Deltaproteobacteria bacterium]
MFSRKKPRGLSADDVTLWQAVVKSTTPLHPSRPVVSESVALPLTLGGRPALPLAGLSLPATKASGKGSVRLDLAPTVLEQLTPDPLKMDQKRFGQMRKGKLAPESRLDLHGLTLDQAHSELVPFILSAWSSGQRLVLVITGKGKPREEHHWGGHAGPRLGVLRHHVPHWLTLPPLRGVVLQMTEAHLRHGGSGAIYVYLRRLDRGQFGL